MAKKRTRTFNVEFMPLCEITDDQEKIVSMPINIGYRLNEMLKKETKSRFMNINGENIRLQTVRKIDYRSELIKYSNIQKCKNLWEVTFIRFKDGEIYGLADEEGYYDENLFEEILNLEKNKNKHLASPTPCIYDANKNIFIIPKNREGVSIGSILEFLCRYFKNKNLEFGYVSKRTNLDSTTDIELKNINFSINGLRLIDNKTQVNIKNTAPTVYRAISACKDLGSNTFSMLNTMGDLRNESLTVQARKEIFALARLQCDNIVRLKIGVSLKGTKKNRDC
ncbi:DUF6731 family protein [Clostridium tetani]|uniref:DUF6731 family protein n=2 Tax=root TaxID=1 RepID=UPI0030C6C571